MEKKAKILVVDDEPEFIADLQASLESWEPQYRPEITRLPAEERKSSFNETELGFSEEKARQEAKRCLRCDLEE
ncbi:hypothetical protein ACFLW2_05280 [Chloroflexota bacterium]